MVSHATANDNSTRKLKGCYYLCMFSSDFDYPEDFDYPDT